MYDLLSIGTLTIDLYFKSDCLTSSHGRFELALGGKYFVDHFYEGLGGGATNVAIGVQKHGWRTSLKTIIGNNAFKRMIIEKLHETGVSYLHSRFVDNHLNISSILVAPSGEKTVINYQNQHQHLFAEEKDLHTLTRSKTVFLGNLPDVSLTEKVKILHFLKRNQIRTIVNMGVNDCRRPLSELIDILEYTDILIINGYEFADLVKKKYEQISYHQSVLQQYLLPLLKVKNDRILIVTDGSKGSYGYKDKEVWFQTAIAPPKIIDSTGAGDGYTAGFIAHFLKTHEVPSSMLSGAHYAAKILGKIGAN